MAYRKASIAKKEPTVVIVACRDAFYAGYAAASQQSVSHQKKTS